MGKKSGFGHAPSILAAVLCAFTFCLYIPLVTFYGNTNSFAFGGAALAKRMAVPFIVAAIVLTLFLINAHLLLFRKSQIKLAGIRGSVSPIHVLAALIVFCLWLEGFLLSKGLPKITGQQNLFSSVHRLVIDSAVWILILLIGLTSWRVIAKHMMSVFLFLALLLASGIADAVMTGERQIPVEITAEEVLDRAAFHPDTNVMFLLTDAMSTALVLEYLDNNPAAADELDGFVLFQNNLSAGDATQWAVPSILKGTVYAGGSSLEFQSNSFDVPDSMPRRFLGAGYDVYSSSIIPMLNKILLHGRSLTGKENRPAVMTLKMYGLMFVRFAPYALKNAIANRVGFETDAAKLPVLSNGNLAGVADIGELTHDELAYRALENAAAKKNSPVPTFHFHHVKGAHAPYETARDGARLPASERFTQRGLQEQSVWTWRQVRELLRKLKQNGLYDRTTLVILGDHGDRRWSKERPHQGYANSAALLVKPAGSKGPLAISKAPTSTAYLSDIVSAIQLRGGNLAELTRDLPPERQTFALNTSSLNVYKGVDFPTLELTGSRKVEQSFTPTVLAPGITYSFSILHENMNMASPVDRKNINIENGWGLRITDKDSEISFLTTLRPKRKVKATFTLVTAAPAGGETTFDPYVLTVKDMVGNGEDTYTIERWKRLDLEPIEVDGDSAIKLKLSVDPFLKYNRLQYLIEEFAIAEIASEDNKEQ